MMDNDRSEEEPNDQSEDHKEVAEAQSRNAAVVEPHSQPTQSAPQTRLPVALRTTPRRRPLFAIVSALGMSPISVERANHSADLRAKTAVADADDVATADLKSQTADWKSQTAVADVDDVVAVSDTSSSDDKPLSNRGSAIAKRGNESRKRNRCDSSRNRELRKRNRCGNRYRCSETLRSGNKNN